MGKIPIFPLLRNFYTAVEGQSATIGSMGSVRKVEALASMWHKEGKAR